MLENNTQGMNCWVKAGLVLGLTCAISIFMCQGWYQPKQALATITQPAAWTVVSATTNPVAASYSIAGTVGSSRMLVVGVSVTSTTNTTTQTCAVTYGGTALTPVPGTATGTTAGYQHTYLFYMLETGNTTLFNGSANSLAVTVTGGVTTYSSVYKAVFDGVYQSAAPFTSSTSTSNGTGTGTPAFATGLNIAYGDQAVEIINATRVGSTTARTITAWNLNWSAGSALAVQSGGATNGTSNYIGSNTTANASNTSLHTWDGTSSFSMSGMSIKAKLSTITDCGGCHFYPGTSNLPADGTGRNTPAGQFLGNHLTHAGQYAYVCTACHKDNTAAGNAHSRGFINLTGSKLSGSAYGNGTFAATHQKAVSNSPTLYACNNTYCHSNGTSVSTGSIVANASPTWGAAAGSLGCAGCHDSPPSYANNSPKKNSHTSSPTHASSTCDKCHYTVTTNGSTIASVVDHVSGAYNVSPNTGAGISFTYTYAAGGGTCASGGCHGTAQWGVTVINCNTCHNSTQPSIAGASPAGSRRQVLASAANTGEFTITAGTAYTNMTSHVKTSSMSVNTCQICHSQGSHKTIAGGVNVLLQDTRAASGTGTISYDGTTASLTNFCIGCHDSGGYTNIATIRPSGSTATAAAPYADSGDSNAPDNIFSEWSSAGQFTGTSNGFPATTKKTHRRSAQCMDCHGDNRNDSTTTPRINAHASGNGRFLRYSTNALMGYGQTCFNKSTGCHGPGSTLAYTGARVYNQFKVFSSATLKGIGSNGAHPILKAVVPKSTLLRPDTAGAYFVNGWKVNSVATCSDCHGGSYNGPKGPHGSANAYLLKSANTTAYTQHTNGTAIGTPTTAGNAKIMCLNCHAVDVYGDGGISTVVGSNGGTRYGHGSTRGYSGSVGNCAGAANDLEAIGCKNCHAGNARGGTHSTSIGGVGGASTSGPGFMNGNCWTAPPDASNCYATTRSAENGTWSTCTKGAH